MEFFKINEKELVKVNKDKQTKIYYELIPFRIIEVEKDKNIRFSTKKEIIDLNPSNKLNYEQSIFFLKNSINNEIIETIRKNHKKILENDKIIKKLKNIDINYEEYYIVNISKDMPIYVVKKNNKYKVLEIENSKNIKEVNFNLSFKNKLKEINKNHFIIEFINQHSKYLKNNNIYLKKQNLELQKLELEIHNLNLEFILS